MPDDGILHSESDELSATDSFQFRFDQASERVAPDVDDVFPTLRLAQVYGAIAFYLNHQEESDGYLASLGEKRRKLEQEGQPPSAELQKRIEAARQCLFADKR